MRLIQSKVDEQGNVEDLMVRRAIEDEQGNNIKSTYATKSEVIVPTKTSELTNDSGFITNTVNNLINYYTKTETDTKNNAQDAEIAKKADQTALDATNATLADTKSKVDNFFSEAGVDGVIDTLTEIVEYIEKDEQGAIDLAGQVANNTSQIESIANTYASKEYVTTNIQQYIDEAIDGALEGNY